MNRIRQTKSFSREKYFPRFNTSGDAPFSNVLPVESETDSLSRSSHTFSGLSVYAAPQPTLQTKLTVNEPGDKYEQEADAMADKIMRVTDGSPQRKCAKCEEEEEKGLQRKESGSSASVSPAITQTLQSSGQPLDTSTRSLMEQRFGYDFSNVRVHNDTMANQSAKDINAFAYTHQKNIVFGAGQYQPQTKSGRKLLAHELTHVIQQNGGSSSTAGKIQRTAYQSDSGGPGHPLPYRPNIGGAWTIADLKRMLDTCDGGIGIWAKARTANRGREPSVTAGSGGFVDDNTGAITIDNSLDKCNAVQQLIQELSNLSRIADLRRANASALAGDLSRSNYITTKERIEYETGVLNDLTAFDACKDVWPCTTARKEWARKAKDFQDYFDNYLGSQHKEGYGTWWDTNCKAAYDRKHPARP